MIYEAFCRRTTLHIPEAMTSGRELCRTCMARTLSEAAVSTSTCYQGLALTTVKEARFSLNVIFPSEIINNTLPYFDNNA